jgi:hypothetical protein
MRWYEVDGSGSGEGLLGGSYEHGNEPSTKFGKFLSRCTTCGFSMRAQFNEVSFISTSKY